MGCDESLWGSWLGIFVWGVLLMGAVHISGGFVVGEVWCEFLVLFMAGLSLGLSVGFCFPGVVLFRVVALFVSGMRVGLGRLRLWVNIFSGCRIRSVVICWVCCDSWSVLLT